MSSLSGRSALITGGSSGIGHGIALRFKEEGATGVIVGRDAQALERAGSMLGTRFYAMRCDVTSVEQLDATFQGAIKLVGNLDVLVVNAGGAIGSGTIESVVEVKESSFNAMVDLNLKSVFFTVQRAIPYLNPGASVILVSSVAAHKGFPNMSVYAACKAGVRSLARSLALELVSREIRVNVISPGVIDTPVFSKFGIPVSEQEAMKDKFSQLVPAGRMGRPDDIAGTAVFLASPSACYITGQEIIVDGGLVAA